MKKTFLIIQMLICATICFAQKEITISVSGEGRTKTEATDAALRSAIEQTFGAFVSTNTTILNDKLIKDEIATVSSGNIKKYTEVNYFEKNGKSYVTLNATISIGKLISYAKSKGSSCELDGATFSAEIRKNKFYRDNTMIVLDNLVKQINILKQDLFSPKIDYTKPYADGSVFVRVNLIINDKILSELDDLIFKTLKSVSIDENEAKRLKENGESVNEIEIYEYEIDRNHSTCMYSGHAWEWYGVKKTLKNTFYILWDDNSDYRNTFYSKFSFKPFYLVDNLGNKFNKGSILDWEINNGYVFDLRKGNRIYLSANLKKKMKAYKYMTEHWEYSGEECCDHFKVCQSHCYTSWFRDGYLRIDFRIPYDVETLSKITGFTIEQAE